MTSANLTESIRHRENQLLREGRRHREDVVRPSMSVDGEADLEHLHAESGLDLLSIVAMVKRLDHVRVHLGERGETVNRPSFFIEAVRRRNRLTKK